MEVRGFVRCNPDLILLGFVRVSLVKEGKVWSLVHGLRG